MKRTPTILCRYCYLLQPYSFLTTQQIGDGRKVEGAVGTWRNNHKMAGDSEKTGVRYKMLLSGMLAFKAVL